MPLPQRAHHGLKVFIRIGCYYCNVAVSISFVNKTLRLFRRGSYLRLNIGRGKKLNRAVCLPVKLIIRECEPLAFKVPQRRRCMARLLIVGRDKVRRYAPFVADGKYFIEYSPVRRKNGLIAAFRRKINPERNSNVRRGVYKRGYRAVKPL